jgi:hypothetical protein
MRATFLRQSAYRRRAAASGCVSHDILVRVSGQTMNRSIRQQKPSSQRRGGGAGKGLRVPAAREVYAAAIAGSAELMAAVDALDAELWVASNISAMRCDVPTDEAFTLLLLDLIDEAERDGRTSCLVLLKAIASVGPREVAGPAARAAKRLAGRGRGSRGAVVADSPPLPSWIDLLGQATAGECFLWTDEFGEYCQVFCEFVHADGDRRHGLNFTIDRACHGVLSGIAMVSQAANLDRAIGGLRRGKRGRGRVEPIGATQARGLVLAAIEAAGDQTHPTRTGPEPDERFHAYLPLVTCRMLGIPAGVKSSPPGASWQEPAATTLPTLAQLWPARRRAELVDAFFAAHPRGWDDPVTARMFVERIVDASIEVLGFPPDRIGPVSVARLFGEVLPRTLLAPEVLLRRSRKVAKAWVVWLCAYGSLSWRARRRVRRMAFLVLLVFAQASCDRRVNPHSPYVADLPAQRSSGEDIQEALDRRWFAMPAPGRRGEITIERDVPDRRRPDISKHVDDLDAASSSHREAFTVLDQFIHGADRDVIGACVAVVEQLWTDEPAQVWQAAQRLDAAGLDRQQVIRRLAQVWRRHGPADMTGYAAALESLDLPGREATPT